MLEERKKEIEKAQRNEAKKANEVLPFLYTALSLYVKPLRLYGHNLEPISWLPPFLDARYVRKRIMS